MPVFAVIPQSIAQEALVSAIKSEFPNEHYDLGQGVWLVSGSGTAREISDKLKITPDGANGTGVVIEAASYYGRANPAIWTWMKNQWLGNPNG